MTWCILNVDDNEAGRYSINRLLRREGYSVLEAATGLAALASVRSNPVDLVVLDVNLPDVNGLEICEAIKSDPETSHIPVLLLSASRVEAQHRVEGLETGADGYLVEPIEPEVLLAHVRALLRLRRAERRLHDAVRDAENANRAKDHFLAVLSHELRTPLTPVFGAVDLLTSMDLEPDVRNVVDIIQRNVRLEARLIDDLLDVTRIERGKLDLRATHVDLDTLINEVALRFRSDVTARGLKLLLDNGARDQTVVGDASRLQQVITNLLTNAMKFTERGSITISTSNPHPGIVRVSVCDTGIGIEPASIAMIFNAFDQGSRAVHQHFGGLGLGLAISRGIVDAHGGTIGAASDGPGLGSTVWFELATSGHGVAV